MTTTRPVIRLWLCTLLFLSLGGSSLAQTLDELHGPLDGLVFCLPLDLNFHDIGPLRRRTSLIEGPPTVHSDLVKGVVPFEDRHGNPEGAIFFESSHVVAVQVGRLLREQQEFTLSAWIWPFVHKWRGVIIADSSSGSELQLALSREGHLEFVSGRGEKVTRSTAARIIPASRWTHVAVTYQNMTATLYINGYAAKSATLAEPARWTSGQVLVAASNASAKESFPGALDDVRVYNRALDHNEVRWIATW